MLEENTAMPPLLAHHKKSVEITRSSFEKVFNAIIDVLSEKKEIKYSDLYRAVAVKLNAHADDSVPIYTAAIKQYMEHQGIIESIPLRDHEYLRLTR